MARSDAVGKEPTIDELNAEATKSFKGLTMTDGVISDGGPTAEEKAALAAMNALENKTKTDEGAEGAEGAEQESAEDKAAREAREANMTDKQKAAAALQQKVAGKDGGPKQPYQRSAQARIDQAVKAQRAAERALDEERGRNAQHVTDLERRLAALENRPLTGDGKQPKVIDKDAPRPQDYEFGELDTAYIRDVASYETRKAIAAENQQRNAASQTEAQRQQAQEFVAKAQKFEAYGIELYDDFNDVVVQGAKDRAWPLSKEFGELMFDSKQGPHIAYYLATHVNEAKRIMALSPTAQAAAFGRLDAAFSSTSSDATQQENGQQNQEPGQGTDKQAQKPAAGSTTKVPPPPEHQARGAGGKTKVGYDSQDFAAVERQYMSSH